MTVNYGNTPSYFDDDPTSLQSTSASVNSKSAIPTPQSILVPPTPDAFEDERTPPRIDESRKTIPRVSEDCAIPEDFPQAWADLCQRNAGTCFRWSHNGDDSYGGTVKFEQDGNKCILRTQWDGRPPKTGSWKALPDGDVSLEFGSASHTCHLEGERFEVIEKTMLNSGKVLSREKGEVKTTGKFAKGFDMDAAMQKGKGKGKDGPTGTGDVAWKGKGPDGFAGIGTEGMDGVPQHILMGQQFKGGGNQCVHYLAGNCRFGDACRFDHGVDNAFRAGKGSFKGKAGGGKGKAGGGKGKAGSGKGKPMMPYGYPPPYLPFYPPMPFGFPPMVPPGPPGLYNGAPWA